MAQIIKAIGGLGNATEGDVLEGVTFSGENGIRQTGTIPSKEAATYTPGTSDQEIAAGQYLSGKQTIKGDSDLVSANIKAGVNIFGVDGKSSVVETSDATAAAGNILSGKTAYVDGAKVTGNIPSKEAATYTPGTAEQSIEAGQYLSGKQTIAGDADLIPANIKQGVNIFGVDGELIEEQVTIDGVKPAEKLDLIKIIRANARVSTLPYEFFQGSAVVLNGEIHILGSGNNSYYRYHYKWDGSSWSKVSTLPYNFYYGSAVVLNGEIHILGSLVSSYYRYHYKWDGSSWSKVSTLPYDFYQGSAVVLNGEIHILGSGNSSYYKKHYKWNGSSWVSVSTLPYDFYQGSAVVLNGEIHILGMYDSSYNICHYKRSGTSWKFVSTISYAFIGGTAVVLNNEIHILGAGGTIHQTVFHYKRGTSWTNVGNLPYSLSYGSAVVLNNEIHILGSYYNDSNYPTDSNKVKHYCLDEVSYKKVG